MVSITPSFRQLYHEQVEELKRGIQYMLLVRGNREALNLSLREAWSTEGHAMADARIPCTLDTMNLMANAHDQHESCHSTADTAQGVRREGITP